MFAEVSLLEHVETIDLPTGHWPMWSRPRDLAAVMPHATLSIGQGAGADANGDRGGQSPAGGTAAEQGDGERDAGRGRTAPRPDADRSPELPRIIQTMPHAGSGTGLDIFA